MLPLYSPRLMPTPPFTPERSIALVGLMGAGKTEVGRRLAERLDLPFADTDDEVARSVGLTVPEIFEREGEAAFRERERVAAIALAEGPVRVAATGGGAFADDETRGVLLARCIVVWLDAPVPVLARRVAASSSRPLLSARDPLGALTQLAAERAAAYAQAHLRVAAEGPPDDVADAIVLQLAGRP